MIVACWTNSHHSITIFISCAFGKTVRSITHQCVTRRHLTVKPHNQMHGQLPFECVTPGSVFERVGVDYAGPFQIKYGFTRKPTIVEAYNICVMSLYVKAVHLELVSDLTAEAFIATLPPDMDTHHSFGVIMGKLCWCQSQTQGTR